MSNRKDTALIRIPVELHKRIKENAKQSEFTSMVAFLTYLIKNYNEGK
jgi:hypothetical protein